MRKDLLFIAMFTLAIAIISANNCGGRQDHTGQSHVGTQSSQSSKVDKDSAIRIATEELIKEERSVDKYNLKVIEHEDAWRIECNLKDRETMGGGVIYVIDWQSGKILKRETSQ